MRRGLHDENGGGHERLTPPPPRNKKEVAMKEMAAKSDDCQIRLDKIMADMKKS